MPDRKVKPEALRDDAQRTSFQSEVLSGSTPGPESSRRNARSDQTVSELRKSASHERMRAYKGIGLSGAANKED